MEAIKLIHVTCALLSISGFIGRGVLIALDSPLMGRRWIRVVPHVVDATLLGSAIAMVVALDVAISQTPWLQAKIAALLLYIALGFVVMRFGRTKAVRMAAWVAAIAVFGYIVAVAVTKNPLLIVG